MNTIGFSADETKQMWSILSGILQFGNMEFVENKRDESASIKTGEGGVVSSTWPPRGSWHPGGGGRGAHDLVWGWSVRVVATALCACSRGPPLARDGHQECRLPKVLAEAARQGRPRLGHGDRDRPKGTSPQIESDCARARPWALQLSSHPPRKKKYFFGSARAHGLPDPPSGRLFVPGARQVDLRAPLQMDRDAN